MSTTFPRTRYALAETAPEPSGLAEGPDQLGHGGPRRSRGLRAQPLTVVAQGDAVIDILLVDDDAAIAEMYRLQLVLDGYRVTTAADGEEAIATAKQLRPNIVFLDVRMPKKDGFDVLLELQADPATAHIPVIVLSNYDQADLIQRGLGLGAAAYLIKSNTTPGSLSEVIDEWMRR